MTKNPNDDSSGSDRLSKTEPTESPDARHALESRLSVLVFLENTNLTLLGHEIFALVDTAPSA